MAAYVRVIGQEPVGLFGHVSCCSSCRIGWSACHVRAIPVAVFRRVQETVVADPPVLPHGLVVHLAGLARGFHVHAVQGFVGFLAGVNVVDDGLGEMRAPCGDAVEFKQTSALNGPVGRDVWIIPPVLHADVAQMVDEDVHDGFYLWHMRGNTHSPSSCSPKYHLEITSGVICLTVMPPNTSFK